jgi:hypothetical protein
MYKELRKRKASAVHETYSDRITEIFNIPTLVFAQFFFGISSICYFKVGPVFNQLFIAS